MGYIFTSESVSEGHPDKVCDQISDAILDSYLAQDPNSRVACETLIKNNTVIVAAGLAERCEVQVSYAIGIAEPTSITVDTLGTGTLSENEISQIVRDNFDLRPKNLINLLDLKRPIYKNTASYGHFGRENKDFSWENTDISSQIK